MKKQPRKTLLQRAMEIEPKPYVSRMGWENHPTEEALDLAIAYCLHKVGATAFTKLITGKSKATNTPYIVAKIFEKALRAGLLKRVYRRKGKK